MLPQTLKPGILAVAVAAALGSGTAAADPDPTTAPPAPAPAPEIVSAQTENDPGSILTDLLTSGGRNPADQLSQAVGLSAPPPVNPLVALPQLMPQNYRMPDSDLDSPYPLAPNDAPSPFARVDAFKGVHALLYGGLGRMPGADLGQPVVGTAPPPGASLPPGLEQFYIDPAAVPSPQPAALPAPPG